MKDVFRSVRRIKILISGVKGLRKKKLDFWWPPSAIVNVTFWISNSDEDLQFFVFVIIVVICILLVGLHGALSLKLCCLSKSYYCV